MQGFAWVHFGTRQLVFFREGSSHAERLNWAVGSKDSSLRKADLFWTQQPLVLSSNLQAELSLSHPAACLLFVTSSSTGRRRPQKNRARVLTPPPPSSSFPPPPAPPPSGNSPPLTDLQSQAASLHCQWQCRVLQARVCRQAMQGFAWVHLGTRQQVCQRGIISCC